MSAVQYLRLKSRSSLVLLCLVLVAFLGFLDHLTGPEFGFSLFYLLPVSIAAWLVGLYAGVLVSLASAASWLIAELLWRLEYSLFLVPYWNTLMRLGFFLIVTVLLAKLRETNLKLEMKVVEKTASLEAEVAEREQLQEDMRMLASVVENGPDSVVITDRQGLIEYVNVSFERITGYTRGEVIGKTPRILKSGHHDADYYRSLWNGLLEGRTFRATFNNKKKNGEIYAQEATITPVLDKSGNITNFVAIGHDITGMRKLEAQLFQAQKLDSLGTLAGGIAHDFNNILAIILGHAGLARKLQHNPKELQRSLETISTAVQRGASLVRQLLTFSRKSDTLMVAISVNDAIEDTIKLLRETLPKTIVISSQQEKELPSILADSTQLHQVLLNLCVNARDAMPDGGTIMIRTGTETGKTVRERFPNAAYSRYVVVSVADSGTGMDGETRDRIFEPFFSTKEKGKGTGLGLSVVYGIMMSHDGFIDVESAPGQGTTFRVYFPVKPLAAEKPHTVQDATTEEKGGKETILVVEDEEELLDLLATMLSGNGYKVLTAKDGEDAVTTYTHAPQDIALVLCDMGLPKLNGMGVLERLRNINPSVRFVLASGFLEPEQRMQLGERGARGFIQKPYVTAELLKRIREILDTG